MGFRRVLAAVTFLCFGMGRTYPLLESVCEIYIANLKRKGVASLPTLTKAEAPTTLVALRAAGFKGRITRKAVLAWFDGE